MEALREPSDSYDAANCRGRDDFDRGYYGLYTFLTNPDLRAAANCQPESDTARWAEHEYIAGFEAQRAEWTAAGMIRLTA